MKVLCNGKKLELSTPETGEIQTYDFPTIEGVFGIVDARHTRFPMLRLHIFRKTLGLVVKGVVCATPVYPKPISDRKPGENFLVAVPGSEVKGLARVMAVSLPSAAVPAKVKAKKKGPAWYPGILDAAK